MSRRGGLASRAHLRRLLIVPLAVLAAGAIGACAAGGSEVAKTTPAQLVRQAFVASGGVESGRLSLSVALSLEGVKGLGGPIALSLSGPFQRGGGAAGADLAGTLTIAGSSAAVGFDVFGGHLYLGIDGTFYELPGSAGKLGRSSAPAPAPVLGATGASGLFGSLGLRPGWLISPHVVGSAQVAGTETEHLSAGIDVGNLLSALRGRLAALGGASPLAALPQAITQARVDVYSGVLDNVVRRVDLTASFTVPPGLDGVNLGGLRGGTLTIEAQQSQLDEPQTITAPAGAEPYSQSNLLNGIFALESRFGAAASLLAGHGTSLDTPRASG